MIHHVVETLHSVPPCSQSGNCQCLPPNRSLNFIVWRYCCCVLTYFFVFKWWRWSVCFLKHESIGRITWWKYFISFFKKMILFVSQTEKIYLPSRNHVLQETLLFSSVSELHLRLITFILTVAMCSATFDMWMFHPVWHRTCLLHHIRQTPQVKSVRILWTHQCLSGKVHWFACGLIVCEMSFDVFCDWLFYSD